MVRAAFLLLAGLALLAGCGGAVDEAAAPAPVDAAISDALFDPIMTDPDLASQNQAHAAVAVGGPASSALPPIDRSDAAIDAARDEAAGLLSGATQSMPAASAGDLGILRGAMTSAQVASAAGVASTGCVQSLTYTARWTAMLPAALQVYPRAAVEEAAGTDAPGCGLRVVHFKTPVALDDVMAFHSARLRAAGYPVEHCAQGGDHMLRGRKGASGYALYLRKDADGLTAGDIVVAGI